jgi:hypothetical protein
MHLHVSAVGSWRELHCRVIRLGSLSGGAAGHARLLACHPAATSRPRCFYPTTALLLRQRARVDMHVQRCRCCLQLRLLTGMLSCVQLSAQPAKHRGLGTYLSLGCRAAMEMPLMPHTDRGSCCCHSPAPRRRPACTPKAVWLGFCPTFLWQSRSTHQIHLPLLTASPTCQGSRQGAAAAEGAHSDTQAACLA